MNYDNSLVVTITVTRCLVMGTI